MEEQNAAQHSVHPTGGSLRVFKQFAWLEVGSVKVALSRPTHQRVTPAVGLPMKILNLTSMSKIVVEIRPVLETDIPVLEKHFFQGSATKHIERYARQQKGEVVYLVASYEGQPVGHALLNWRGSQDAHVANHLEFTCPDIEGLFVLAELRSQGIGRQVLSFAERLAVDHGDAHMGLSVAKTNESARRLYERLGYKESPFGEYIEQGESIDSQGQLQSWQEICIYLIKDLRANGI